MRQTLIKLLVLCAIILTPFSHGDVVVVVGRGVAAAGATYIFNQGFEGAGYDNGETWGETADPNEDDTTAPSPLVGSQSLRFNGTTQRLTSPAITEDDVWTTFQVHFVTLPTSTTLLTFLGPGVSVDLQASGAIRIGGTVNSPSTTDTYTTGVKYFFKCRYSRDTDGGGGSAVYSVEFNTTGTFNGSGNDFTSATTGTDAAQCTNVRWHAEAATTVDYVLDAVLGDDVDIP